MGWWFETKQRADWLLQRVRMSTGAENGNQSFTPDVRRGVQMYSAYNMEEPIQRAQMLHKRKLGLSVIIQSTLAAFGLTFENLYRHGIQTELHNRACEIKADFQTAYEKSGRKDFHGQIPHLDALAGIYHQRGLISGAKDWPSLLRAHAMYNSCGARDPANQEIWADKAYKVQQTYWGKMADVTSSQQNEITTDLKNELLQIRERARKELNGIEHSCTGFDCEVDQLISEANKERYKVFEKKMCALSSRCNDDMIKLSRKVIAHAEHICSKAPCDFTALAIGSLARGEGTPYSDLEFLFLLTEKTETNTEYFERLAMTSYFLIGNLGETKLRYMAIDELDWFDDASINGFKIDGLQKHAGNIPTGNGSANQHNHFICTPDELAERYKQVFLNPDPKESLRGDLTAMLASTTLIYGSENLHKSFRSKVDGLEMNEERREASRKMLMNDLSKFNFYPDVSLVKKRNVKMDIYRYPSIISLDLKILHNIAANDPFRIIKQLIQIGVISEAAASCIRFSFCSALYMRLSAYLYHSSQNESISVLSTSPEHMDTREEWYVTKPLLLHMMIHLVPLKRALNEFNGNSDIKVNVSQDRVTAYEAAALVSHSSLDFSGCIDFLKLAHPEGLRNTDLELRMMYSRALIWCSIYSEAIQCLEDILESDQEPNALANAHNYLGEIHRLQGNYTAAIQHYEKSIQLVNHVTEDTTTQEILAYAYHEWAIITGLQGRYTQSLELLQQSIQIRSKLCGDKDFNEELARSHVNMGNLYKLRGEDDLAILNYKKIYDKYLKWYGDADHDRMAYVLVAMGTAYCDKGNFEAALEVALKGKSKLERLLHGTDHAMLAAAYNNIGFIYSTQGKQSEASKYLNESLEMKYRLYGDNDHPEVVLSLINIASLKHIFCQQHDEALMTYIEGLHMLRRIHGQCDHRDIATILSIIASTYASKGDYKLAKEHHTQALEMRRRLYGDNTDHPDIAAHISGLAAVHHGTGNYKLAFQYYSESLDMYYRLYGDVSRSQIAVIYNSISQVQQSLGNGQLALKYCSKALIMMQDLYQKEDHSDLCTAYSNMACIQGDAGNSIEAIDYYEKSLQIRERLSQNSDHKDVATTCSSIAKLYIKLGNPVKALEYQEKALRMQQRLYGDVNHLEIASSYSSLTQIYSMQGAMNDALKLKYSLKSLEMKSIIYGGTDHPDRLKDRCLTQLCDEQGNCSATLEFLYRALAMNEKLHNCEDHSDTAFCHNIIAGAHMKQGNYAQALLSYDSCLTMTANLYGVDNDPSFTQIYCDIAGVLEKQGHSSQAQEYYLKAIATWKRLQGDGYHPTLIRCYMKLTTLYRTQRYSKSAIELYTKILEIQPTKSDDDCRKKAVRYSTVAVQHRKQGNDQKALELCKKSCTMLDQVSAACENHEDKSLAYNNIAGVSFDTKDYMAAEEFYRRHLSILQMLHSHSDHEQTATALSNLGRTYYHLKDYQIAIEYYLEALHMMQRLSHGSDTSDTDAIVDIIAHICNTMGNKELAMEYHSCIDHLKAPATRSSNLGRVYSRLKDHKMAIEYYSGVLRMKQQVSHGSDSPDIAAVIALIANLYDTMGDKELAIEYHTKSLEMKLRLHCSAVHSDVISSYNALVLLYGDIGNDQLCTEYQDKLLEAQKQLAILHKNGG